MREQNFLNVFKGVDSVREFYNPDNAPPVPLVEIPRELNPFYADNVRIYAKLLTALPAANVKALPALNMLEMEPACAKKAIVESSSGSTATSLGLGSRILYGNNNVHVYITNKCERGRLNQLLFWGLKVHLYGGPAQPEIDDERGIVARLNRMATESPDTTYNPNQYINENNWRSHIRWTGPQIWEQLPEINVFAVGMGSTGCLSGTGMYLKKRKPDVKIIGVCNAIHDPVPGPRPQPLMSCSEFPWREVADHVASVSSEASFARSLELSREGIAAGPSSGLALQGLLDWLSAEKSAGCLSRHADMSSGQIHCVFVCCDLPHMHLDQYFAKLDNSYFHPIVGKELLAFDQDHYDLTWELLPEDAMRQVFDIRRNCKKSTQSNECVKLLDLRSSSDFAAENVLGSISSPLNGLDAPIKDLFWDNERLYLYWNSIQAKFNEDKFVSQWMSKCECPFYIICYEGEVSRLMTAVLRAKKIEAFSVKGGIEAIKKSTDGFRVSNGTEVD